MRRSCETPTFWCACERVVSADRICMVFAAKAAGEFRRSYWATNLAATSSKAESEGGSAPAPRSPSIRSCAAGSVLIVAPDARTSAHRGGSSAWIFTVVWPSSSRSRRIVWFPLAPGMSHTEGALVEPLANALHVLSRIPNVRGGAGLIYGAGPIGLLSVCVAKEAGAARLAVVDRNPHRLQFASDFGADLVIDASKEDPVEVIQGWTANGQGADFAIEAVGAETCRRNAMACTAAGGTVVCVGLDQEICPVDTRPLVVRELDVRGVYAYTRKEFAAALEMMAAHRLNCEPWVTTASMDAGQRIFEELAGGQSPILKAVFLNHF